MSKETCAVSKETYYTRTRDLLYRSGVQAAQPTASGSREMRWGIQKKEARQTEIACAVSKETCAVSKEPY